MNKEFIPYEQALELRYIGYNYESSYYWTKGYDGFYINYGEYNYTNNHWMFNADDGKNRHLLCIAPLYQQVFRWFREKYGLMGVVDCFFYNFSYTYNINDIENEKIITMSNPDDDFTVYEESELACLKKLIEIAKNK